MNTSLTDLLRELELMGPGASLTITIVESTDGGRREPLRPQVGANITVHSDVDENDWKYYATNTILLDQILIHHLRQLRVRDEMIRAGWTRPAVPTA